ncbi:MAG: bis(5'-nucleosyl)-tetraphosphatase (symmetrical) YqeK [Peptococcaceae bacterium]|nr:bis(5'-nucleosyl)-tetraphosphatase (symmetrical) YqeK [Peptococcaceae bacterium]
MNYKKIIQEQLSEKRFAHSVRVAETAVALAEKHHEDASKARIAGLMHDYCKEMPVDEQIKIALEHHLLTQSDALYMPQVLHGPVASVVLKEEGLVTDEDILQAIRFHTTGDPNMDALAKIIFIADYIEPGRKLPDLDALRDLAMADLDRCVAEIINKTIDYLLSTNRLIHADMVKLRNTILIKEQKA